MQCERVACILAVGCDLHDRPPVLDVSSGRVPALCRTVTRCEQVGTKSRRLCCASTEDCCAPGIGAAQRQETPAGARVSLSLFPAAAAT